MDRSQSASITVSRRDPVRDDSDAAYTVVWVGGEHDIATKVSLVAAIAGAAQRDGGDLLVDLSGVTFMDASTIGALVGSRNRLRPRSRSLELRAPSAPALRLLELCGLANFVRRAPAEAVHPTGAAAALSTWVDVPSTVDETVHAEDSEPPAPVPAADARASSPGAAAVEADRGGP